jgi:hypothetical protein
MLKLINARKDPQAAQLDKKLEGRKELWAKNIKARKELEVQRDLLVGQIKALMRKEKVGESVQEVDKDFLEEVKEGGKEPLEKANEFLEDVQEEDEKSLALEQDDKSPFDEKQIERDEVSGKALVDAMKSRHEREGRERAERRLERQADGKVRKRSA